jgi:hypothetical protein
LEALERQLDRLGLLLMQWWVWPLSLLLLGVSTYTICWLAVPGPHESVLVFGEPLFPPCPVRVSTGTPCGQCGMTRSFVWAARGHLWRAWLYNPAGLALWGALMGGAVVGGLRLWRRDPALLRASWWTVGAAALAWLVLYAGAYLLRRAGLNPLP